MADWLVLLAVGIGTYLMRVSFLAAHPVALPPAVERALPHVGPAVLAAVVVPALILPGGTMSRESVNALLAAAACGLAWWRSGSTPLALAVGLAAAWIATAISA